MTPRSWLFVPGDNPRKMEKALSANADALILDLEDSVGAGGKAGARAAVTHFLQQGAAERAAQLWVRINPLSTPDAQLDLSTVICGGLRGIVLPKPDSADDVRRLGAQLDGLEREAGLAHGAIKILPIATETPLSIFRLDGYAGVRERLGGLTWGAEDLSAAVGAITYRTATGAFTPLYDLARSLCLAGAAAAEVGAIETVYPDFRDLIGLARYASEGRRDGFVGMMAIHPDQVGVINAAFRPSQAEVDYATRLVDLFAQNPGAGTLSLDGKMVDAPHLKQAQRILGQLTRDTAHG